MWKPKLNPVTERRIRRFKSIRRSYWSLWILFGLYVVSLLSDFLSNDRPLFLRFEGKSYYPIFFYYPDDEFTGSGLNTRADFKEISAMDKFQSNDGNFMVFPLIKYGPFETLRADQVDLDKTVVVSVVESQEVGTISVDTEFEISGASSVASLFGLETDRSMRGEPMSRYLNLSEGMKSAMAARFSNNVELEAFEEVYPVSDGLEVKLSLSRYSPRPREPRTVRLTVREQIAGLANTVLNFDEEDNLISKSPFWRALSNEVQVGILERVSQRRTGLVDKLTFESESRSYAATFDMEEVAFPFRPTNEHWLGLDSSGRDVAARILYAARISLNFGFLLVVTTMLLGTIIGGIQGFYAGKIDLFGQRLIEIWEALPFLLIMIFMGSVFGSSFMLLLVVYGVFNWIGVSYYMRGEFLKFRKQPFVEAAHCLGLPSSKIMRQHILPNAVVPLVTYFPFSLIGAIFSLSALDFLGFGLPAPTPSWGQLLSQAQEFRYAWWLVVYPFVAIFGVCLLSAFIGEGVRAAFDPRVNSRYES